MSKLGTLGARLHRGEIGYDFVGKRKIWYGISILITITAILGLSVRGLNMGIEFEGGAVFTVEKTSVSVSQAEKYAEAASGHDAIVQTLGKDGLRIQVATIDTAAADKVSAKLATDLNIPEKDITGELVGPSWGDQVANKAWQGLVIFMILVVIYLAIAFEWRMAIAALVALLPVAGLLVIGGGVLGAGMLNDISLSLFVGLAAGAYSSIFIATPLVADLKEHEPQMKALKRRVLAKRAQAAAKGETAGAQVDDEQYDDEQEDAAPAVVGPRNQPASRNRGRGRPSGKRR
jgi:preprotein translocase subunit SecF